MFIYEEHSFTFTISRLFSSPIILSHPYSVSLPTIHQRFEHCRLPIPNINKSTKEFPLLTKAGIRLDVLLNATTRRNEQGNIIGVVGIGQDITGRLAQEREYTRLIDTANAPIFGVNQFGRVNVWNKVSFDSDRALAPPHQESLPSWLLYCLDTKHTIHLLIHASLSFI
jgi:hypothetical protein